MLTSCWEVKKKMSGCCHVIILKENAVGTFACQTITFLLDEMDSPGKVPGWLAHLQSIGDITSFPCIELAQGQRHLSPDPAFRDILRNRGSEDPPQVPSGICLLLKRFAPSTNNAGTWSATNRILR